MRGRGLILAAPASGSGKTLLTAGLLRALRDRGVRVAAAKAGPDYIDPTFHAAASGGACINLDVWAMRPATLAGLVGALEADADIVLCEGVMGLFDGTGPDSETGSTAALAKSTGWPVVLVVDARGQGASAAALVAGFAQHDPGLPLAGVIFNRVAGARHRAVLEAAMARHLPDIPCLGALPQNPALVLPERHLGLVPAREAMAAASIIALAAQAVAASIDLDRLVALARRSGLAGGGQMAPLPGRSHFQALPLDGGGLGGSDRADRMTFVAPSLPPRPSPIEGEGVGAPNAVAVALPPLGRRIAIARDDAFLFAYPSVLDGWCRQGAELSFFSPLADETPEVAANAIYLPGGYPELHAGRLAAAEKFLSALRRAAAEGAAIYGECGGYMVLGDTLTDADGHTHRMAGLLPLATSFAERRLHLGYRAATLVAAGPLGPEGARFRGHEFHYATTLSVGAAQPLFALADASGADLGVSGLRNGNVAGSFIHLIDRAPD
ncbi:MAG TPA: cobyrinate a,c-diamide synthase [Stellaceae bacterium]|nr:cobyrinate a,c-diamide synthase [Stellaceae bacterium]